MELILSPEEEKFRDEVREFVSEEVSEEIRRKTMTGFRLNKEDHESWQRKLHSKGWMAPGWPAEYGGTGWTPMQKHIFEEECAAGNIIKNLAKTNDLIYKEITCKPESINFSNQSGDIKINIDLLNKMLKSI